MKKLPITNKTILVDSKILDIVTKWAEPVEPSESLAAETTEDESESLLTPPISTKSPVSILTSLRDTKPPKKKVKFADEASSSDSESRTSELEFPGETESVSSSSQSSKQFKKKSFELRRKLLDIDGTDIDLKDILKGDVTESEDLESQQDDNSQDETTQGDTGGKEKGTEENVGSEDGKGADVRKPQQGTSGDEVANMATSLLDVWANLKVGVFTDTKVQNQA